jgi:ferritin-like metal-binding protein YciE
MANNMNSLKDLFIHEIKDLYSAETQLTDALPKMAEKATDDKLKNAFKSHLEETKKQKERLEKISQMLDIDIKGEKCEAMAGLIKEGKEALEMKGDDEVRDAALIGAAQRVEHYEMAGYGTARNYAKRLGFGDAASLLEETLNEEKTADSKLNDIAISRVNERAQNA